MGIVVRRMTYGEQKARRLRDRDLDSEIRNDPKTGYYQSKANVMPNRRKVDDILFEKQLKEELFNDYPE